MSFIVVLLAATTTGLATHSKSSFEELKDEIKHASIDENSLKQSSYIKITPAFLTIEDEFDGCPPGFFSPDGGIFGCYNCPSGFYCFEGAQQPILCPAGTFNPDEASPDASSCLNCPQGFYCTEGSASPITCAPGTYNPYESAIDVSGCLICDAGFFCPEACASPIRCPGNNNNSTETGLTSYEECPIPQLIQNKRG